MYTLGINAVYHDPAAVLVKDGQVVAAAEEERFTQIKHGKRPIPFTTYELPFNAMDYVLRQGGITINDVDHIAYSYDPWLLLGGQRQGDATISLPLEPSARPVAEDFEAPWDPLFLSYIVNAPRQLAGGAPHHLKARFKGARPDGPYRWHFVEHHNSHAASAFLPSPFQEAAILTLDGRGEKATTTYDVGHGTHIERLGQVNMPHSLGILYEQVTEYLGFLHSSDEYKVMALASFGKKGSPNGHPKFLADFFEIITLGREGQYEIQPSRLEERFGPRRERGGPLEQRHYDVAYALQLALEETVLELAGWLHRTTGMKDLALAGGVALNVVMNSCIRDKGPFEHIWVQPAAGDAGTALGAALWVDAQERTNGNGASGRPYCMDHAFLGPEYSEQEIENYLRWSKLPYRRLNDIAGEVAGILAADKIIGWFQGKHEFGPRALGARSILASPISPTMQARLNDIKDREDFGRSRPLCSKRKRRTGS